MENEHPTAHDASATLREIAAENGRRATRPPWYWPTLATLVSIWGLAPLAFTTFTPAVCFVISPLLLLATVMFARVAQPPLFHSIALTPRLVQRFILTVASVGLVLAIGIILTTATHAWPVSIATSVACWFATFFSGRAFDTAHRRVLRQAIE